MRITARPAGHDDLAILIDLYRGLEAEQVELKDMWSLADALPEPAEQALAEALEDERTVVYVGEIDEYPFGFSLARIEGLLPQAGGTHIGSVRFIYTDPDARGVGVGEAMINALLDDLRDRGLERFDAHVLPGHRAAKNFFEASGFAARSIVMHNRGDD